MPIYTFGTSPEGHTRPPTRVYPPPGGADDARPAFHSWTHTLLHTPSGLLQLPDTLLSSSRASVIGADRPFALLEGGRVHVLSPSPAEPDRAGGAHADPREGTRDLDGGWTALAPTDAGPALGVRGGRLYALPSLPGLPKSSGGPGPQAHPLAHPLLRPGPALAATERRAAVLSGGEVLEAVWDWRRVTKDGGEGWIPRLEVVEELSGLGVVSLVAGRGDRFGVVTAAGEGYVLDSGGLRRVVVREGEADSEDDEGEEGAGEEGDDDADSSSADGITALAPGPDYDLAIVRGALWARGNNDFGQLGQGHTRPVAGWVRVPVPPAVRVLAGRFSGVVQCEAEGE